MWNIEINCRLRSKNGNGKIAQLIGPRLILVVITYLACLFLCALINLSHLYLYQNIVYTNCRVFCSYQNEILIQALNFIDYMVCHFDCDDEYSETFYVKNIYWNKLSTIRLLLKTISVTAENSLNYNIFLAGKCLVHTVVMNNPGRDCVFYFFIHIDCVLAAGTWIPSGRPHLWCHCCWSRWGWFACGIWPGTCRIQDGLYNQALSYKITYCCCTG